MKRILVLLFFVLCFSGCGSSDDVPDNGSEVKDSENSIADSGTPLPKDPPTQINYSQYAGSWLTSDAIMSSDTQRYPHYLELKPSDTEANCFILHAVSEQVSGMRMDEIDEPICFTERTANFNVVDGWNNKGEGVVSLLENGNVKVDYQVTYQDPNAFWGISFSDQEYIKSDIDNIEEKIRRTFNYYMNQVDSSLLIDSLNVDDNRYYHNFTTDIQVSFITKNEKIAVVILEEGNKTSFVQNRTMAMIWGSLIEMYSPNYSYDEVMETFKANYSIELNLSSFQYGDIKYDNAVLGDREIYMMTNQIYNN